MGYYTDYSLSIIDPNDSYDTEGIIYALKDEEEDANLPNIKPEDEQSFIDIYDCL